MGMDRDAALYILRSHRDELRAAGVESAALFGSTARGEARPGSDVDLVVRLAPDVVESGFGYFGTVDRIRGRLAEMLGVPVDLVVEPVRRGTLRETIMRDRAVAF